MAKKDFLGQLKVTATYSLNEQNELKLEYRAVTSKPTVLNLTNHSYFNLSGNDARDVMGDMVTLHADRFTPVDATLIPPASVAALPVRCSTFVVRIGWVIASVTPATCKFVMAVVMTTTL